MANPTGKREAILRAAGAVIVEWGAEKMTLEAVAQQAGVSKGGLLYHFASKEALIAGMVARLIAEFEAEVDAEEARLVKRKVGERGRFLRAYVTAGTTPEPEFDSMMAALLAAVTSNPPLLAAMREADARWQARAEADGIEPQLATVIRLAADGCWMSALFGFEAGFESDAKLRAVQATLLRLIDRAVADADAKAEADAQVEAGVQINADADADAKASADAKAENEIDFKTVARTQAEAASMEGHK